MTATNQNVGRSASAPFIAGDSLTLRIECKDQDGTPLDLSGATSVRWELFAWPTYTSAKSSPGTVAVVTKALGSGITVPAAGVIQVTLAPADTASLDGGYWHEAQVTLPGGVIYTVMTGTVLIARQRVV